MTYRPIFVKQADGSALQWSNCGPASSAMHLDRDTRGAHRTTGARVRLLTGDHVGGTNLGEDDAALLKGWPERDHMDVRPRLLWTDAMRALDRGQGLSMSISYAPFSGTKFDGSPGFTKNHRIFVNERAMGELLVFDPLDDKRRTGIPAAPVWVPETLVRKAAGLLDLNGAGLRLGLGWAQVGLTRDTEPNYTISAISPGGTYFRYFLNNTGGITTHTAQHATSFTYPCSSPRLHSFVNGRYNPRSLVKILSGPLIGWYVQANSVILKLRTV